MIVINGRFLTQRMTGVHRFAYEMTCALWRKGLAFVVVAPRDTREEYACPFEVVHTKGKGSHLWEQAELPHYLHKHYPGALLITWTGLSPLCYSPSYYTIHDVSYLENPAWFSLRYYLFYRLLTPIAAARSQRILTVSRFSKQELQKHLSLPAEKITVVYNAVENMPEGKMQETNEPYILSVCSMDPRKNLRRLTEAFTNMEDTGYRLYLAGGSHTAFRNSGAMPERNSDRIRFLGYVSDEQLCSLYRNAVAFVSPSVYEGFGIPNLEAMRQGCPVVVSDIPAYREVCGDAALYFNPHDTASIQAALRELTGNKTLQETLRAKGRGRYTMFSWERSAETVMNLIEEDER
jgi:glycosyltransferase involved in cell wall biosynthesis